jgi:GDP-L-fucose synthase
MEKKSRIFVAGHRGLVGSAITRVLQDHGYNNVLLIPRSELDLRDQSAVRFTMLRERPEYVFLAAARVGGILANRDEPGDFVRDNLLIQSSIIDASFEAGVKRLLFLGSSCIYPKYCDQPIKEEYLLAGPLEPTNRPYAVAKIAGIELCWGYNRQFGTKFLAAMPTNLYGEGDYYDPQRSHVVPGLLRRFHLAKLSSAAKIEVWGTGKPRREFLHSSDAAEACVFLMNTDDQTFTALTGDENEAPLINIGSGFDISIEELAGLIARTVGFKGNVVFDSTKPDGTPRKLLDVTRISRLGWKPRINLEAGLEAAYQDFLSRLRVGSI